MLTAEFKINLLRPARGERLHCSARGLKPGRRLIVVESDVFIWRDGNPRLTAKAMVTIAPVMPEPVARHSCMSSEEVPLSGL